MVDEDWITNKFLPINAFGVSRELIWAPKALLLKLDKINMIKQR